MRWLTTLPRPPNRKRQRPFGARYSLFRVHFYVSIPLSGPSLTKFLDPPLCLCNKRKYRRWRCGVLFTFSSIYFLFDDCSLVTSAFDFVGVLPSFECHFYELNCQLDASSLICR